MKALNEREKCDVYKNRLFLGEKKGEEVIINAFAAKMWVALITAKCIGLPAAPCLYTTIRNRKCGCAKDGRDGCTDAAGCKGGVVMRKTRMQNRVEGPFCKEIVRGEFENWLKRGKNFQLLLLKQEFFKQMRGRKTVVGEREQGYGFRRK